MAKRLIKQLNKDKEVVGEITIVLKGIDKDKNEEINKSDLKDLKELTMQV